MIYAFIATCGLQLELMTDKSHHKGSQARIVGYLDNLAVWPSVFGRHTFGIIISIQNGIRHDPDLFETRIQTFRCKDLSGKIIEPFARIPVGMHKIPGV